MTKDMFQYSRDSHRGLFSLSLAGAMCFSFKWASHSQRSVQGLNVASLVGHHHAFRNIAAIVVLASSAAMVLMKELRIRKRTCFTENSATNAWNLNFNNGNFNNNNKTNENLVRPVSASDRIHKTINKVCAPILEWYNRRYITEYIFVLW